MRSVPAAHGAVVAGLLPLATAVAGALIAHERPSRRFWACAVAGSAVVVGFALWEGGGAPQAADLLLVGAVAAAAIGYAEGARLSRVLGGWQVISLGARVLAAVRRLPGAGSLPTRASPPRRGPRGRASPTSPSCRCSWASSRGTAGWRWAGSPRWASCSCCSRSSPSSPRRGCCAEPVGIATYLAAALVVAAIALAARDVANVRWSTGARARQHLRFGGCLRPPRPPGGRLRVDVPAATARAASRMLSATRLLQTSRARLA